jgi:biopolymer transport protein ExbB
VADRLQEINRRSDYEASSLFHRLKQLIEEKKFDEANQICASAGRRALPRIIGAGIKKAQVEPRMVGLAMAEESTHMATAMERRLNYLVMFGNVSTLLGLLGTVFGLIMSFAAVGKPGVAAVEKSAMLATGISAAMNATLVGLSISVPCVMAYAFLRARVDAVLQEIDRYAIAALNLLCPPDITQRKLTSLGRNREEEEVADTDVTPMLNLMVLLIPFLLTSSEFVKIGAIEIKLPESAQGVGGEGGGMAETPQEIKLDMGVAITSKGFRLFHYFKNETADTSSAPGEQPVDIPLVDGKYDYKKLNRELADVKQKALVEIVRPFDPGVSSGTALSRLYKEYLSKVGDPGATFPDHEAIKIVAEETVKYQVVIAVMDAARGIITDQTNITMFPNVSLAGGIVQ